MKQQELDFTARFDGSDIDPKLDQKRLSGQLEKIFNLMKDGSYRTLRDISDILGYGESSISANLRNLRKVRFGLHTIDKRRKGEASNGLWEYKLITNKTK